MTDFITLSPVGKVDGEIRPPGSKSITNRALICSALAEGTSRISGALVSEDTEVMRNAWTSLGVSIRSASDSKVLEVDGCGGQLVRGGKQLFIGNSGTSVRFLTAALAACQSTDGQPVELDGVPRMRQRPIRDLLDALTSVGASVHSLNEEDPNCPPVRIFPKRIRGGTTSIRGDISSQYLSGLMMAAPMAETPVSISIDGDLVSIPYVDMTAAVMRSFGASVEGDPRNQFTIPNTGYVGLDYDVEPDASAASYFWGAAALTAGKAKVLGLSQSSLQGDVRFCKVLEQMGCQVTYASDSITVIGAEHLRGVDVSMADISDTVQTLAAIALFAEGPTRVRDVAHNRVKETDRIGDLATELRRLGAEVTEYEDGLEIHPRPLTGTRVQTYDDHRMAMSLSLVGLRIEGVEIENPGCTQKTYPEFWTDLAAFSGCRID